jgi:DnaJ like chaperone protein
MAFLERVAQLFGISPLRFRRLKADHLGLSGEDPYRLLEVHPDASDETVRSAWKRALSAAHPDRAMALGLSHEGIEAANDRSQAINAAFAAVMRERRSLMPATL